MRPTFLFSTIAAMCLAINSDVDAFELYGIGTANNGPLSSLDQSTGADSFIDLLGVHFRDLASDTRPGSESLWGVGFHFQNFLWRLNPEIPAIVHAVELLAPARINTLAIDPTSGQFYGTSYADGTASLHTIDPSTGSTSVVGNIDSDLASLAFDQSGRLFGTMGSSLFEIDTSNAAMTTISNTLPVIRLEDLASRPTDNSMFALGYGGGGGGGLGYSMFSVDVNNGAVVELGPSVFRPSGLAFFSAPDTVVGDLDIDLDVDGLDFLLWQRHDGSGNTLASWQDNFGLTLNNQEESSDASQAIPEPATYVLFTFAVCLVLLCRKPFEIFSV